MALTEVEILVQSTAPTVVSPTYVPIEVVVQGPQGIRGLAGTLAIGTTTTGAAGTSALVTNTGTPSDAVLNFTVPQGIQGIQGVKGNTGTLALGTVTTGAAGTNVVITNTGTATAGIFNFTIPKGDKGDTGTMGLGTVTTGAPGSSVLITNTGTPTNGVFNFTIPRGDTGATGTITLGTVATGAAGSSVIITNTGTPTAATFNFTIPQGIQGIPGSKWYTGAGAPPNASYAIGDWYLNNTNSDVYEKTGASAWTLRTNIKGATGTIAVGTVSTGAAGSAAVVTNSGTATTAVFNFTIPQGIQGVQGLSGTNAVGTVSTGAAGSAASITNAGTPTNAIWNFTIPRGDQGVQGIQGPSGTLAIGTVSAGAVGSAPVVTNSGTAQAAIFNFTLPQGAGVQTGGTTGQFLRKNSNTDFDTGWVDVPSPINMATIDTAQTISAVKTFTAIPVLPASTVTLANIAATGTRNATTFLRGDGTWTTVDLSPYVTLAGAQTITGVKTFSAAPVVPAGSFAIAATTNLQATLDAKYSATLGMATTVAGATTYGLASVVGTGTLWARNDHHHGTPPAQTITAGAGITATPSGVNYTITNAGVTSVVAGSNITVSGATGAVTIGTSATPVFTGVTIGTDPAATQPWVTAQINTLINGAPGALDSLNELAAAMGNDPNFATTMTNNLATKAADNTVVHLAGAETVTGAKTFTTTQIFDNGGLTASFRAGATDHAYIGFFARTAAPNTRSGYLGFGSAAATMMTLSNELGGGINLVGGNVTVTTGTLSEGANRVYSLGNKVPIAGLSATGTPSATTFLRGDNTWGVAPVVSVNGRTAAVTGLAEDNTVVHLTGAETIAGVKTFSSAPVVPANAFPIAAVNTLQTTLDAKYSATNVPPYPITSVAGRGGAVTLTASDIGAGTFAGTMAFSSQAVFTAGFASTQASGGIELGASSANTPFIDFHSGATSVDYDTRIIASGGNGTVGNGTLTLYAASVVVSGSLNSSSTLSEAGVRVYSPSNAPVQGIPFHVGGTVGTGLKPPKFIAPAPMTLRSSRASCETAAALDYRIYVNGVAVTPVSGVGVGAAAPVYVDFPDVNINAGDKVQLFVNTADATSTELSVTVEAVTR